MAELKRITCVEDDKGIQAIVDLALTDLGGFEVTLFSDGPSALEQIEAVDPQLVILDMMMPKMTGVEILQELRAREPFKTTPVIIMTAKAQSHEVEAYIESGAQAVIIKPFDPVTLSDQVLKIWDNATVQ